MQQASTSMVLRKSSRTVLYDIAVQTWLKMPGQEKYRKLRQTGNALSRGCFLLPDCGQSQLLAAAAVATGNVIVLTQSLKGG